MKSTLCAFGFDPLWVSWIVNLTSSALFSILVNGVPFKIFSPSRGIRKGDPLYPFLFIIMVKWLSRAFKLAITDHSLSGLSPHVISPPILHSQFVDNILLMEIPIVQESLRICSIINILCDPHMLGLPSHINLYFYKLPTQGF
jgi:hypothetical protein